MASVTVETLADLLAARFPQAVVRDSVDMPVIEIPAELVATVLVTLRDEAGYAMLSDVSGVDRFPSTPRFAVNYHMRSFDPHGYVRVTALADEGTTVPSVTEQFPTADWQEREVFDMFGIAFSSHPNLTRILLPDEWEGHPLRKDYPIGGVPVEYRIEPSYAGGGHQITDIGRSATGGQPARLTADRRRLMTWTGPPASGVRERGSSK